MRTRCEKHNNNDFKSATMPLTSDKQPMTNIQANARCTCIMLLHVPCASYVFHVRRVPSRYPRCATSPNRRRLPSVGLMSNLPHAVKCTHVRKLTPPFCKTFAAQRQPSIVLQCQRLETEHFLRQFRGARRWLDQDDEAPWGRRGCGQPRALFVGGASSYDALVLFSKRGPHRIVPSSNAEILAKYLLGM